MYTRSRTHLYPRAHAPTSVHALTLSRAARLFPCARVRVRVLSARVWPMCHTMINTMPASTSGWIRDCYGREEGKRMGPYPVICSGSIFGTRRGQ